MEKKWRAIYVNSRAEKKVMETLLAKGIEAYVPLMKTMRQWSDRKKLVELPLLNGYVFVHINDKQQEGTLQNRSVVAFVRSEGRIAEVRDVEIARLKQLVELGYQVESMALTRELANGEKVKITSGPLKNLEGVVLDDRDQRHLLVMLESIGQCIRVRLPQGILSPTNH